MNWRDFVAGRCAKPKPVYPLDYIAAKLPVCYGAAVCVGALREWAELPISNLPPDTIKVRRRIRNNRAARAFVKTSTEVQHWILAPDGDNAVKLMFQQGMNTRPACDCDICTERTEGDA